VPSAFWRGSESVSKIYLGTAQVWPAGTVPGAPTIVTAIASLNETNVAAGYPFEGVLANAEIVVDWTAPASNGGSAITGYIVSRGDGNLFTVSAETRSYTFTGVGWSRLTCSTWTVSVRAVNAVGQSAEATATAGPIPGGSTPTLRIASKVGNTVEPGAGGVTLTAEWTPVCASDVTGYQLEYRPDIGGVSGDSWTDVSVTGLALTKTFYDGGGYATDSFEVRVRTVKSSGFYGPWATVTG